MTLTGFSVLVTGLVLLSKLVSENKSNFTAMAGTLFIVMSTFTLSLLAIVSIVHNYKASEIIGALAIMTLFVGGTLLIIKQLSSVESDMKNATVALLGISAFYLVAGLTISQLVIPIGKHLGDALKGSAVVLLFTELTILMMKQLGSKNT